MLGIGCLLNDLCVSSSISAKRVLISGRAFCFVLKLLNEYWYLILLLILFRKWQTGTAAFNSMMYLYG